MIKRIFAAISRRLIRRQSHLLYRSQINGVIKLPSTGDFEFKTITAQTISGQHVLTNMLVDLNPDNGPYISDIEKDRIAGLMILEGGQTVHYGFVFKSNKTAALLGLPPSTALIGNSFTMPSHRGNGLQARSVHARAEIARSNGFAEIAAETDPENYSSQRGLLKSGLKLQGPVELVVVLNCFVIRWRRPKGIALLGFCL